MIGSSKGVSGIAYICPSEETIKSFVVGGFTGSLGICAIFPTEFVKTQLQIMDKSGVPKFKGPLDCVRKTIKKDGFRGLYKGLPILCFGNFPILAVRFGTMESLKARALDDAGNLSTANKFFCGLGAGVAEAIFASTIVETLKVKYLCDQRQEKPKYRGLVHGIGCIWKEKGVKGLYKGVTATVLKQGSNQAIRFLVLETLKEKYQNTRTNENQKIPKPLVGLMGAVSGAASVFGNTPIDVVKTRMQGLGSERYTSTLDCIRNIWREEGFKAFYKGTVPRLGRVCLDTGLQFMIFESLKEIVDSYWKTN